MFQLSLLCLYFFEKFTFINTTRTMVSSLQALYRGEVEMQYQNNFTIKEANVYLFQQYELIFHKKPSKSLDWLV